jgi:hypothetical protein
MIIAYVGRGNWMMKASPFTARDVIDTPVRSITYTDSGTPRSIPPAENIR